VYTAAAAANLLKPVSAFFSFNREAQIRELLMCAVLSRTFTCIDTSFSAILKLFQHIGKQGLDQ
jgi:hypothetical protein